MENNLEWLVTFKGRLGRVDITHVEIVRATDPASATVAAGREIPPTVREFFNLGVDSIQLVGTSLIQ